MHCSLHRSPAGSPAASLRPQGALDIRPLEGIGHKRAVRVGQRACLTVAAVEVVEDRQPGAWQRGLGQGGKRAGVIRQVMEHVEQRDDVIDPVQPVAGLVDAADDETRLRIPLARVLD